MVVPARLARAAAVVAPTSVKYSPGRAVPAAPAVTAATPSTATAVSVRTAAPVARAVQSRVRSLRRLVTRRPGPAVVRTPVVTATRRPSSRSVLATAVTVVTAATAATARMVTGTAPVSPGRVATAVR